MRLDPLRASVGAMHRTVFGLPFVDAALAAALLVVKVAGMATGVQTGGGVTSYVLAPLWTLPLVWRRRAPVHLSETRSAGTGQRKGRRRGSWHA